MNSSVLNRVKRNPIVVFLRKIYLILLLLLIILLSLLFGFWNIKTFEFKDSSFVYVNETDVRDSLKGYVGENIFLISPYDIERDVKESSGYISDVTVDKILPNKISLSFKEFTPYYVGYAADRCILFSKEGIKLEELCEECNTECLEYSESLESVSVISDSGLDSNNLLIFREEFDNISRVLEEFGYSMRSINTVEGLTTIKDTQGHTFVFDITYSLDLQLSRMYLVGEKINEEDIQFSSLDLRFERPVMKLK